MLTLPELEIIGYNYFYYLLDLMFKQTFYGCKYHDAICEELKLEEKYVEIILFYLDDKGLLEHGGSIRGSWLSDKGKKLVLGKYKEVFE